jgi:cyclopropane-fatty-acyl-phospholipid synthase
MGDLRRARGPTYGVNVVGVTLSREQADYARKRMIEEGTSEFVEIRV